MWDKGTASAADATAEWNQPWRVCQSADPVCTGLHVSSAVLAFPGDDTVPVNCGSLSERLSPLLHAVPSPHCHRHAIKLDHHHDRPSLGPDWPSISKSIVNALVLIIDACGIYRRGKVPANGNRQKQQKLQHLFRISSHTLVLQKSDTPVTRADGHAAAAHAHGCTRLTPGGVTTIAEPNRNTTHAHKHRTHHVCPDQHPVWNPRGATCIFGLKSQ